MKKIVSITLLLFAVSFGYSQKSYGISFKELEQKMAQQPRPILIKMYTGWCAICKIQDKQIEKDSALQQLFANNYYYIELDAESREPITFNTTIYTFIPHGTGGLHALAALLGDAKGAYPSWVLLSPDYKIEARYNGLIKSRELVKILSQFSEQH
ncbi:thioredoxin family protein [Flavobacterium cerinum]|uniref:Thioredoxin family protein n=1 Tax=Flavobacterium cerinum TaxID=2502784 RepID=A0A444HFL2_9FLAO|nr:thioredoxin family protein [Flavobacterium cerinum]RWX03746.1 hypothetical protein EPI11_02105 [Flavobacterium cerinum]